MSDNAVECEGVTKSFGEGDTKVQVLRGIDLEVPFGEMSLLDHGPRAATIVADTPMHLLVLDPRSFVSLLDDVPSVARKILRVLAERLREVEKAPTN